MLILFLIGTLVLGSGIMMLFRGTYPPPLSSVRANPIVSTFILLIGLTLVLHFGTPDLLDQILKALS